MAGAVPRSLIVAAVLAALVAAGALAGAAAIRARTERSGAHTTTSANPGSPASPSGCLKQPCQVLGSTAIGGTSIELVGDAGGASGRLRIGGPVASQVIETTITDRGVVLTPDSLQCLPGGLAACLIKGKRPEGGIAGEVVVGRSGSWHGLETTYISTAGYLALTNLDGDAEPELLAAQFDCTGAADCADRPVFVQAFDITGGVLGCSKNYAKVDKLPDYPTVHVTKAQLTPCR